MIKESLLAWVVFIDGRSFSKTHKEQRFAATERFFRPEETQVRWHGFFCLFNGSDNLHCAFTNLRIHTALVFRMTRDDLVPSPIVLKLPLYAHAIVKEAEQWDKSLLRSPYVRLYVVAAVSDCASPLL